MYPINIADFLFKDGVRVLSATEVMEAKLNFKSGPNLKNYPFLSPYGTNYFECEGIQNEKVLTNQEGKIYFVTSFNYFIDLADLEIEFGIRGHFSDYRTVFYNNRNAE